MTGYEEVPPVSTVAKGSFGAAPTPDGLAYKLSYAGLEGDVTQAHIHFGQRRSRAPSASSSARTCQTDRPGPEHARHRPRT